MTDLYNPPPQFATIEHLRPERTLGDRTRALLTWMARNDIDAWSVSVSGASTSVSLLAEGGADAALAALNTRTALPGGQMSLSPRYDGAGLVIRTDGDVDRHGPVRFLAYVDREVTDLILSAENLTDLDLTDDLDEAVEHPLDPRSLRVAAGLLHLADFAAAGTGSDAPAGAPAEPSTTDGPDPDTADTHSATEAAVAGVGGGDR